MTEHHFELPGVDGGRNYLLEINPQYVVRTTEDAANVIDARWIDTSSGLFIDITAVRKDDDLRKKGQQGALMCKDGHRFDVSGRGTRVTRDGYLPLSRRPISSHFGIVTLKTFLSKYPTSTLISLWKNMAPRHWLLLIFRGAYTNPRCWFLDWLAV